MFYYVSARKQYSGKKNKDKFGISHELTSDIPSLSKEVSGGL